jgi:hypothetical protein
MNLRVSLWNGRVTAVAASPMKYALTSLLTPCSTKPEGAETSLRPTSMVAFAWRSRCMEPQPLPVPAEDWSADFAQGAVLRDLKAIRREMPSTLSDHDKQATSRI